MKKVILLVLMLFLSCNKDTTTEPSAKETEVLFDKFVPYMRTNGSIYTWEESSLLRNVLYDSIILTPQVNNSSVIGWKTPYSIDPKKFSNIQLQITISLKNDSLNAYNSNFYYGFEHNEYFSRDSIPVNKTIHIKDDLPEYMFTLDYLFIAFEVRAYNHDIIKLYDFQITGTLKN